MFEAFPSFIDRIGKYAGPLRIALECLLVALLGLLIARLIWLTVDPSGTVSRVQPLLKSPASTSLAWSFAADRSALTRRNPFIDTGTSGELIIPDAPETKLNLRLKGARVAGAADNDLSVAHIITPDNKLKRFSPGDQIIQGVSLEQVLRDRVLLNKGGTIETLFMESGGVLASVDEVAEAAARAAEETRATSTITSAETPNAPGAATSTPDRNEAAGEGPDETNLTGTASRDLLAYISIDPVLVDGQPTGYRINPRGDLSVLENAGLKAGDVITGVEGARIGEFQPAELANRLSNADEIRLDLDRGGTSVELLLRLEETTQ